MWTYRARILRLVDADTTRCLVDIGFGVRFEVDLRLTGCWMPEAREPGGQEMRAIAQQWADEWTTGRGAGLVWPFLVETSQTKMIEPSQRMTFTRYVGVLARYDGRQTVGEPLNEVLDAVLEQHPQWGHGIGGTP
jgi:hypothetical protein